MSRVFADSHFFFAILNPNDTAHAQAIDAGRRHRPETTILSKPDSRRSCRSRIR
jgi:hypothetical protein